MADAKLVHSTSAERTRDAEEIAALRPVVERAKPRRPQRREPMDRSRTFFCSNPQCDHATWAPAEQATHMAREFWEIAQALVRLAPESPEALKLTGGVILRDLTDEQCREAAHAAARARYRGEEVAIQIRFRRVEYNRRSHAGVLRTLTPEERELRRKERVTNSAWPATRVKALRAELGLTQRQLADHLRVHPRTVQNWERNRWHPSAVVMQLETLAAKNGHPR